MTHNHYICDACHYIFTSGPSPDDCPSCRSRTVIGHSDSGRKFTLPALRPANETEITEYEKATKTKSTKLDLLARIDRLSDYKLNDNEYHLALMLLFYFKSAPAEFIIPRLDSLLHSRDSFVDGKLSEASAMDLYISVKKHFTSVLGDERRKTDCNDAIEVASYTENDSAAHVLLRFRSNDVDQFLGKTPNPTNIRNVRFDDVAKDPGDEYLRFLMDWYNSISV